MILLIFGNMTRLIIAGLRKLILLGRPATQPLVSVLAVRGILALGIMQEPIIMTFGNTTQLQMAGIKNPILAVLVALMLSDSALVSKAISVQATV